MARYGPSGGGVSAVWRMSRGGAVPPFSRRPPVILPTPTILTVSGSHVSIQYNPLETIKVTTEYSVRTTEGLARERSEQTHQPSRTAMKRYAQFLRTIAAEVPEARLSTGARVSDASDFRQWLLELAEKAERAENLEQFLSQTKR